MKILAKIKQYYNFKISLYEVSSQILLSTIMLWDNYFDFQFIFPSDARLKLEGMAKLRIIS